MTVEKLTNPKIWHVVVCLPDLNINHYIVSPVAPTHEEITEIWQAGGSSTVPKPIGWRGPLANSYPGVASIREISLHCVTSPAAKNPAPQTPSPAPAADPRLAIPEELHLAARELAGFASYAEIVGGISVNRDSIRKLVDDVFRLTNPRAAALEDARWADCETASAPETQGTARFGHHPSPAADFVAEVAEIEAEAAVAAGGLPPDPELDARIARAMEFKVGGTESAVVAKNRLRRIEESRRALPSPGGWEPIGTVPLGEEVLIKGGRGLMSGAPRGRYVGIIEDLEDLYKEDGTLRFTSPTHWRRLPPLEED